MSNFLTTFCEYHHFLDRFSEFTPPPRPRAVKRARVPYSRTGAAFPSVADFALPASTQVRQKPENIEKSRIFVSFRTILSGFVLHYSRPPGSGGASRREAALAERPARNRNAKAFGPAGAHDARACVALPRKRQGCLKPQEAGGSPKTGVCHPARASRPGFLFSRRAAVAASDATVSEQTLRYS